jgi:hypothetical protein
VYASRPLRSGYPDVHHYFALEAFSALVNHPRVFLEEQEVPIAVVRGQGQLVARSEHNRFNVGVSPPEFGGELQLVELGACWCTRRRRRHRPCSNG